MDRVRDRQISGICDRFFLSSWDFASESSRRLISFSICIRGEDEMEKEGQRFRVVSSLPTRRLGKTTMVEFVNGQRQRNRVRIDPDPRGVASDGDYARVTRRQSHYCGWYFFISRSSLSSVRRFTAFFDARCLRKQNIGRRCAWRLPFR